jgi:uncharacterized protein YhaN
MRLTELSLEKYGGCASRELAIPETAGLTVVYGANEAGKSTCLEAISDFLFSIPKNTQRGSLFGYDGMRIAATMLMADGSTVTLKRRKGNGKTLADLSGTALDDTVLAPVLGAITRERFETLFGLNHETLRNGGERLLHADGDIGRLIVEAGGISPRRYRRRSGQALRYEAVGKSCFLPAADGIRGSREDGTRRATDPRNL